MIFIVGPSIGNAEKIANFAIRGLRRIGNWVFLPILSKTRIFRYFPRKGVAEFGYSCLGENVHCKFHLN